MRNKPLSFRFFGIDVYIPTSGWLGLLLIAYFALPTSMAILGEVDTTPSVISLALGHALSIYVTIFIHELGHVVAAKKFNYEVQGIFLHLFGGHTSFLGKYRRPRDQFWTAIAGPLATLLVTFVAFAIHVYSDGVIESLSSWLLWSSLVITVVNLLPGVPLDGGGILASVVWKFTGAPQKGQLVAGYGGYFVAALWVGSPFLYQYFLGWAVTEIDIFFSAFIGVWLFSAARVTVKMAKVETVITPAVELFHDLKVRDLARRCVIVDEGSTLGEALQTMRNANAGSILVASSGEIIGIVLQKFVDEDDSDSHREVTIFAQRTNKNQWINYNEEIAHNPKIDPSFLNGQWVAVDDSGGIYGVLHRSDISARLNSHE